LVDVVTKQNKDHEVTKTQFAKSLKEISFLSSMLQKEHGKRTIVEKYE